ncbi:unnamed protein product, partial [Effrenium voratum]
MVEEMSAAVKIRMKVVRISEQDRGAKQKPKKPKVAPDAGANTEPSVVTLRAADLETFLDGGDRPAVLMVKPRSGPWSEVRALFAALSAKLSRFRFAVYNHEEDIDERLQVSAYPAFFLVAGGQQEPIPASSAEEIAAFVAARVHGRDPAQLRTKLYVGALGVLELEPHELEPVVLKDYEGNNRVWIVKYYAENCSACRSLKPELLRAAEEAETRPKCRGALRFAA